MNFREPFLTYYFPDIFLVIFLVIYPHRARLYPGPLFSVSPPLEAEQGRRKGKLRKPGSAGDEGDYDEDDDDDDSVDIDCSTVDQQTQSAKMSKNIQPLVNNVRSLAILCAVQACLRRLEITWDYLTQCDSRVLGQALYSPSGCRLDALVKAGKILSILQIPFSRLGSNASTAQSRDSSRATGTADLSQLFVHIRFLPLLSLH